MRIHEILGDRFKGKYPVGYCELCEAFVISCQEPDCAGSSCNCGGCSKCTPDFDEFNQLKHRVRDYLTADEIKTFEKINRLKHFMEKSLSKGEQSICFDDLKNNGELSTKDLEIFKSYVAIQTKT